jgi:hypothetical protein
MVMNWKTFEANSVWGDNDSYIISIPSGEVIYATEEDIKELSKANYIRYDDGRGILSTRKWICTDIFAPNVKKFLEKERYSKKAITNFLLDCGLLKDQFKIYEDFSVDAFGPVNMSYKKLTKIPVKFRRCSSDFICSFNQLITLENSPFTVHGNFNCSHNVLQNLVGGPRLISGAYNCSHNLLESLKGAPARLKYFNCSSNFLSNLDDAPQVSGNFIKNDNLLV